MTIEKVRSSNGNCKITEEQCDYKNHKRRKLDYIEDAEMNEDDPEELAPSYVEFREKCLKEKI